MKDGKGKYSSTVTLGTNALLQTVQCQSDSVYELSRANMIHSFITRMAGPVAVAMVS